MADSCRIAYNCMTQIRRRWVRIVSVLCILFLFTVVRNSNGRHGLSLLLREKNGNVNVNVNAPRHDAASPRVTTDRASFCRHPIDLADMSWKRKGKTMYADDLMSVEPFKYLDNFKNPCFLRDGGRLSCFPYYFLTGAPKSATTDLSRRIKLHPQVSGNVVKEPHWITRERFRLGRSKYTTIFTYIERFFSHAAHDIAQSKIGSFHPKVVGDCSASTLWDNRNWPLLKENQNRSEPLHTNADYIHHINPNAKIIAILRNPIDRLYSDYLYFPASFRKSPEDFHERSNITINHYNNCFSLCSIRHCLNFERTNMVRIGIGLYYYSIYEWMKVFPRDQVLVIKMEDYSANMKHNMKEIFNFLELEPLDDDKMSVVAETKRISNENKRGVKFGAMLPETRTMLYNFYKPHTEELVKLLGTKFWADES